MEKSEYRVFVQDKEGIPLMPTTRFGKVRRMLKSGAAKVVKTKPFTIRLQYEPQTHVVQNVVLGMDPFRTNGGVCAVREDGVVLFSAEITTRNKEVPKKMADRKEHRHASRNGQRQVRKRRARKCGTRTNKWNPRSLPGCSEPVPVKDICNKEARFMNRKRPKGWLTPTATQLLRTHESAVQLISEILPVAEVSVEVNRFAFMKMDDPEIRGAAYRIGPMHGFGSVREAVETIQGRQCLLCGKPIAHLHHIVPRSENGMDTLENRAGLCEDCHDKVHKEAEAAKTLGRQKKGRRKKYAGASVLNQIMPQLLLNLEKQYPVTVTEGWQTKAYRDAHGIEKTHAADAYCIACAALTHQTVFAAPEDPYRIKQYRRHNRAKIKSQTPREYKLDGTAVAWNRHKALGQTKRDSLAEWYDKAVREHGRQKANAMRSRLATNRSKRRYNNMERIMPGAVFTMDGKRHVLRGQQCNGTRYFFEDMEKGAPSVNAKRCTLLLLNTGLVFL